MIDDLDRQKKNDKLVRDAIRFLDAETKAANHFLKLQPWSNSLLPPEKIAGYSRLSWTDK